MNGNSYKHITTSQTPHPYILQNLQSQALRAKLWKPLLHSRQKTLDHLDTQYPNSQWIHVFTDGSSEDAVKKGAAGILMLIPNTPKLELSIATGKLSTNYISELQAILEAPKALESRVTETQRG